jgi:MscS family membrane protein
VISQKLLQNISFVKLRFISRHLIVACLFCASTWSQLASEAPAAVPSPARKDPLGRSTPRGTVLGFLIAAGKGDNQVAAQYLNTRETLKGGAPLAGQLYVVLNRRLPARLNEISDRPEGDATSLLKPDLYLVGIINGAGLDVTLERVEREDSGHIWLFSRTTLEAIPAVYEETHQVSVEDIFPAALVDNYLVGIPAYEWLFVFVGLPLIYFLTGLLNRLLLPVVGWVLNRLRRRTDQRPRQVLPQPIRLLMMAASIRWLLSEVGLSLIARQFWSTMATLITICGCVWLLILINRTTEQYSRNRLQSRPSSGAASVQRLIRRSIDLVFVFVGFLVMLRHFGISPTAALAGLGVGGIAIALAAQKTLENVVGGVSLILDEAVRVGDVLKVGEVTGTVDDIGLRSIRIRTLDRTMLVIPNGQLANMNLEVISCRDKFWFHPTITLRYETRSSQIASMTDAVRSLLTTHPHIDRDSVRVRFFQLATFSLNIEVFAYVVALDWNQFLRIQEDLLHGIMAIAQQVGVQFAFPSQTTYLVAEPNKKDSPVESLQAASAAR